MVKMPSCQSESRKMPTLKQRKFVAAYVGEANGNASEAARLAGYDAANFATVGHNTLVSKKVQAELARLKAEIPEVDVAAVKRAWVDMGFNPEKPDPTRLTALRDLARLGLGMGAPGGNQVAVQINIGRDAAPVDVDVQATRSESGE